MVAPMGHMQPTGPQLDSPVLDVSACIRMVSLPRLHLQVITALLLGHFLTRYQAGRMCLVPRHIKESICWLESKNVGGRALFSPFLGAHPHEQERAFPWGQTAAAQCVPLLLVPRECLCTCALVHSMLSHLG